MALSKTAKYYRSNAKARAKKAAYDKKFNEQPEQKEKRRELAIINYVNDKENGECSRKDKDYDHATGKYESVKTNRGRKGEGNR